jgi:pimeloyl-ACP methyl ester carboxylesterase
MTWRIERAERREIPVSGGRIVCYLMPAQGTPRPHPAPAAQPRSRAGTLPVLFLPGWGGVIEGFADVIEHVDGDVDLFYLETREKGSSRVSLDSGFSMQRIADDVAAAAAHLGLGEEGYVLMGSSFGASVALEALRSGGQLPRPAVTVLFEPMPRLWLPGGIVRTAGALLPLPLIRLLRPALKRLVLAGMKEEVQRRRAARVIENADLEKWRRAALSMADWHILDIAGGVNEPVAIVQASGDRFHDERVYPRIADAMPAATLYRLRVPESEREALMGRIASAYARGRTADAAGEGRLTR